MKKILFSLAIAGLLFTGCSKDEEVTPTQTQAVLGSGELSGQITADKTLITGNYTLKGKVIVNAGATLTIEKGTTITCDKTTGDNAIVVKNGGKLIMNGTADQPIVLTEKSKIPGSWGGIIMFGDAPVNALGGTATSTSEDGNAMSYGGTNDTHNGGSLKYVRVEYAGAKLADGTSEMNGFSFYAIGSGTTLDHLVSYKGADDGFEFYGGTVSLTNAISYGNTDDSFDWQDGWKGQNNSNWYAYQEGKGNFGIEIETSRNNNAFYPVINNVTLKRATGCAPETAGAIEIDAIQFKKEGNGVFNNLVIDGYGPYIEGPTTYRGAAIKIQDAGTNTNQVNTGKIKITNAKITNTSVEIAGGTSSLVPSFPAGNFTTSATSTGASLTTGNWAKVDGAELIK